MEPNTEESVSVGYEPQVNALIKSKSRIGNTQVSKRSNFKDEEIPHGEDVPPDNKTVNEKNDPSTDSPPTITTYEETDHPSEALNPAESASKSTSTDKIESAAVVETESELDSSVNGTLTWTLESSLRDTKLAIDLFFNNKFDEAQEIMKPLVLKSMYHTLGDAVFSFIEAVLLFEKDSIDKALEVLSKATDFCQARRRPTTMITSISKLFGIKNYNNLTATQLHAELCYAESLLLKTLLALIRDETLGNFIRCGLNIRHSYQTYKECNNMLEARQWPREYFTEQVQSGVLLGIGSFNVMISHLPSKINKILELLSFSGDRESGIESILSCYDIKDGPRHAMSILFLLAYNLNIIPLTSDDFGNMALCKNILDEQLALYPEGFIFTYFKGRFDLLDGNFKEAMSWFEKTQQIQYNWKQFHSICFWELFWTHSLSQNWRQAERYAGLVANDSNWSKSICYYFQLAALLMIDDLASDDKQLIETLLRQIPRYKQRIGGKSLPIETFAIARCKRYRSQHNFLALPVIEILYLWNMLKILNKNKKFFSSAYGIIVSTHNDQKNNKYPPSDYDVDTECLILLLKGHCLFLKKKYCQAEQCLKSIQLIEDQIKEDIFVAAFALVDLAQVYVAQNRNEEALELLKTAKTKYSGYTLEFRVLFRIQAVKDLIKQNSFSI